jgi:hypothetical protein
VNDEIDMWEFRETVAPRAEDAQRRSIRAGLEPFAVDA